jgi:hypothetical protein
MTRIAVPLLAFCLSILLFAPNANILAQTPAAPDPENLFKTIQSLDTKLFDAYNHCDLQTFGSLLDENLEFYHDITGLSRGRASIVEAIKNNICGKVTRELVPGSLEVFAINKYGAVETGTHRFHHPNQKDDDTGEAKFFHLWENKNGTWQLTRVFSFDHHGLKQ